MTPEHLNGVRVTRSGNVIFIPLPRSQWREAGPGCPCCVYCSQTGMGDKEKMCHWDTLAVTAKVKDGTPGSTTWMVHAPELHGVEKKR